MNTVHTAKEAMANRTYVTFGPKYIGQVIAGKKHSDVEKNASFAVALGVVTPKRAAQLRPETLFQKLVTAVNSVKKEEIPTRGRAVHFQ